MNDLIMTVTGYVATDPALHVGSSGVAFCSFRLGSTSRYFDREAKEWKDGNTEWFTVRVFRAAAKSVAESVRKGQPVTVRGRFSTREWAADDGTRVQLQIDATTVGHDLTRGIATFTRVVQAPDESDGAVGTDNTVGTGQATGTGDATGATDVGADDEHAVTDEVPEPASA